MRHLLPLLALLLVAAARPAPKAEPKAQPRTQPTGPIDLTSDTLTVVPGSRTAHAEGHVTARSATFEVTCGEAEATYLAPGAGPRGIEALELREAVHLVRHTDGLVADARQARWEQATGTLVLTGDPVVRRGGDTLRGERIVLGARDDSLEVEGARIGLARRQGGEPLDVRAERLVVTDGGARARFERSVQVREGATLVKADRLDAELQPGPGGPSQVRRLLLVGRVDARRGEQQAQAGKALYDGATGDLTLEGSPVVTQGGDRLEGERIILERSTGRARAERAKARVRSPQ